MLSTLRGLIRAYILQSIANGEIEDLITNGLTVNDFTTIDNVIASYPDSA